MTRFFLELEVRCKYGTIIEPDSLLLLMEKAISELSASTLRKLLNDEIKLFISCLDDGTVEELEERKKKLTEIYNLLTEKELLEMAPLIWGRNTTRKDPDSSK